MCEDHLTPEIKYPVQEREKNHRCCIEIPLIRKITNFLDFQIFQIAEKPGDVLQD
jgi:hypothetical protein